MKAIVLIMLVALSGCGPGMWNTSGGGIDPYQQQLMFQQQEQQRALNAMMVPHHVTCLQAGNLFSCN